jgi:hypothetical protein
MVVQRSQPAATHWSLSELTVHQTHSDLLEIEPLDLGTGAPASAALAAERESTPHGDRDGQ